MQKFKMEFELGRPMVSMKQQHKFQETKEKRRRIIGTVRDVDKEQEGNLKLRSGSHQSCFDNYN